MSDKEVFILGSGFSKAIKNGMPLLSELNKRIEEKIISSKKENIYKKLYSDFIISNHFSNFEEILTFLYQDYPWKSDEDKNLSSALYIYLVNIMTKIFENEEIEFKIPNKNNAIKDFIRYLILNNSHVITFNYDTLIEKVTKENFRPHYAEELKGETTNNYINSTESINGIKILIDYENEKTDTQNKIKIIETNKIFEFYVFSHDLGIRELEDYYFNFMKDKYTRELYNTFKNIYLNKIQNDEFSLLDFYQMPFTRLTSRTTIVLGSSIHDIFRLYKLHGSINWYYFKENISSQIYLYEGRLSLKDHEAIGKKDLIPLIIPPIFDKSIFMNVNTIRTLWADAKDAIKSANEIFIIGYSIPESDLTVKYLLKSNINKEAKIFLINIDVDMDKRVKNYFEDIEINTDYLINDENVIFQFIKEKINF